MMPRTERSVELPWVIGHIGQPASVLDIGSADAQYLGVLFELCRNLHLCDTRRFQSPVPCRQFIGSADALPADWVGFDMVTCVSTLDHIGLDAYGNVEDAGLLGRVADTIAERIVTGGTVLLTVPFGKAQITQHPGGGQRIFDWAELTALFSEQHWSLNDCEFWRVENNLYHPVTYDECKDAGYDGMRAEACIALELIRL